MVLALSLVSGQAGADCADPPSPGVDWNNCRLFTQDLSGSDLTGAKMQRMRADGIILKDANLSEIDAFNAKFLFADLRNANFERAKLSKVDFTKANLEGASLRNAILRRASFFKANLRGVDLTGANMARARLTGADLTNATWTDGKRVCGEGSIGQCR